MKSVTAYNHFDGICRQAMSFYQKCLGGDLQLVPYPDATAKSPSDPMQKIMHSQISRAGISLLMASDGTPGGTWKASNNFSVSVECESIDEIERLFATLGEKGHVGCPLNDMPWGARFGMLTDQFGVQWLFNCALAQ